MEANLKQFVFKWDAILDRLWPVDAVTIDQLHRELKELKAALALTTEPIRIVKPQNEEEGNSASEGFEVKFCAPEHPAIRPGSRVLMDQWNAGASQLIRAQALEEAAKVCVAYEDEWRDFGMGGGYHAAAAANLQRRIRDLVGQLNTPAATSNTQVPDLHSTMDAKVWTDEFCRINPNADWGTMIGWFSNAIMAGFDEANRRAPSNTQVPEEAKGTECFRNGCAGCEECISEDCPAPSIAVMDKSNS